MYYTIMRIKVNNTTKLLRHPCVRETRTFITHHLVPIISSKLFHNSSQCYSNNSESIENEGKKEFYRKSPLNIQMLSKGLYNQVFKNSNNVELKDKDYNIEISKNHLKEHGLWGKDSTHIPDVNFDLPSLEGSSLLSHLSQIGHNQAEPYKRLLTKLTTNIPNKPDKWSFLSGWTKYDSDGTASQVSHPDCDALVFDIEVCVGEGQQPTLATAVSDKCWYSWCSKALVDPKDQSNYQDFSDLIPLENSNLSSKSNPKIVVGHNVSYDRLRVKEQYSIRKSGTRFVDTMSLNIAVCGLIHEQRTLILGNKNLTNKVWVPWMKVGCPNSLKDCFNFHCKGEKDLTKDDRNIFVKGSLKDIREDFQNLMNYCAGDVIATRKLLCKLLPLFFNRFPHPITFAGMLEMGSTFLPVTDNWNMYISNSEKEYFKFEDQLNDILVKYAKDALSYRDDNLYQRDPWLWNLDWSIPRKTVKYLQDYPNWYRKLCKTTGLREGTPEPERMTTSLRIIPKLLKLTWEGYPLHYESKYGWGYLKPVHSLEYNANRKFYYTENGQSIIFPLKAIHEMCSIKQTIPFEENKPNENEIDWEEFFTVTTTKKITKSDIHTDGVSIGVPGVLFFPLPHKNGPANKVGNPLAKDFLRYLEDKVLASHIGEITELVLKTTKTLSYWRNNRDRILSQNVVWTDKEDLPKQITDSAKYSDRNNYGVILPQVVVAGTVTRRAVEKTWMTASNAYPDRIGSELKAFIEAPPGYHFVGADVDSQELWIAAVLGDSYFVGLHGSTALGWMTLQGKKADGTDMHSRTAEQASISRDQAKIINYGRIYGAGLKFVQQLLQQFNPNLTEGVAREKASNLITKTKGEKCWYLNKVGEDAASVINYHYDDLPLTRRQVNSFIRKCQKHFMYTFNDVVEHPSVWMKGSESYTFNCLEAVIRYKEPRTPVLGARISRSLEPDFVENDYMTSRMNWVVQSSAVDYLHLLLVSMEWLCKKYNIDARFCISIHDEVRYMVASQDRYRAALALQIANLHTRSIFSIRLGMNDLPLSVAFFSGVDIDTVLRKEPHMECITPSNPKGLMEGYGISPGETLDIYKLLEITGGNL